MARLPDVTSLGVRPVPVSRRSIATVRNAGAVADAVGDIGGQMAQAGEQMMEQEDKLSYAAAKTALLRADVTARDELRDDPDYGSYEKRYQEKIAAARTQASGLLRSKMDRRLFEVDTAMDVERGAVEVRKMARDRGRADRVATLDNGLTELRGVARSAMDDATREEVIRTANTMVSGAIQSGDLDPIEGVGIRQKWTGEYINEQIDGAIDRGEVETAKTMLGKFGKFLPSAQYMALTKAIDEEDDGRVIMSAADIATGNRSTLPVADQSESGPLRMPVTGRVTGNVGDPRPGGRTHNGLDIAVPVGTPVTAPSAGVITKVWNDPRGGLSVLIDHGGGLTTGYAHLSSQDVKVGQSVVAGELVAKSGNTGASKGPHLHWTAKIDGKPVDPRIAKRGGTFDNLENAIERGIVALGPNATTKQVEQLRRELTTRFQIRKAADDENEENSVEAAQAALVKNGGNWYALPASMRRSIPAKYHPGLINFGDGLRPSAPARKTDPMKYVEMSDMAATNPEAFASINPVEYRGLMDDGDWNRMVALRSEIRGGARDPGALPSITEIRTITKPALEAAGITTRGLRTKDVEGRGKVAARIYSYEKAVLGDLQIWQQNNPGKKPSALDVQKIADRRLILVTPAGGEEPVPQFEAPSLAKMKIPTAEVDRIKRVMTPILGREPLGSEIIQAYISEGRGGS